MEGNQVFLLPGPTPLPQRVIRAMAVPIIQHRGPEFKELLWEVTDGIKEIYQTNNDLLILTASGTGGMEAAVANFLSNGDKALVISVGAFGERFKKICSTFGVVYDSLDFEWGRAADPELVSEKLREDKNHKIKAVLCQHSETSTGVLNDIEKISRACQDHPALLIVDAISGLGAADLKTDAWNLDVVISGSQKSFMVPPGLATISVSGRAWEAAQKCNNKCYYFNLKQAKNFFEQGQTPFTPAVSVFLGLRESLKMMREEGLPAVINRHYRYRDMVRAGIRAMGLEPLVDESVASPALTSVKAPPGVKPQVIRQKLLAEHNVVVAGGQGKLADSIFRIGHLGFIQPGDIFSGLASLELVIRDLGVELEMGSSVKAAQEVYCKGAGD